MKNEAITWGQWMYDTLSPDGYRLDAVKCIDAYFMSDWITAMRAHAGTNLFAVGEYWTTNLTAMQVYEQRVNGGINLFDFSLHYNMYSASQSPTTYDMRQIFANTWVQANPVLAVTFVDNHDTQPGQSGSSFIEEWFRPIAYALILTRQEGYPCVFYADYYGSNGTGNGSNGSGNGTQVPSMWSTLVNLMNIRRSNAYGREHEYFSNPSPQYIGWTSEGDETHGGLAAVVSTDSYPQGYLDMYVGTQYDGQAWIDATDNFPGQQVIIDSNGNGHFLVKGLGVTIWIPA